MKNTKRRRNSGFSRRRRRNSDDQLRKLERAAKSGRYDDVAAYWLALLRSGQMPKPTFDHSQTQTEDGSYSEPWIGWTIYMNSKANDLGALERSIYREGSERVWQVQISMPRISEICYVSIWDADVGAYSLSESQIELNMDAAWARAKVYLKQALTKYDDEKLRNGVLRRWRRNPDDELRRLQRSASQGEASDVLKYYAASWRAGEVAKGPPVQVVGTESFLDYRSFHAPIQFWIFPNGWALSGWWDMGRRYLPYKLSEKANSSVYVDTPLGRWVDVDWRDLARVERYTPIWNLAENRGRYTEAEMLDIVANLRSRPKEVIGFADRLGGA